MIFYFALGISIILNALSLILLKSYALSEGNLQRNTSWIRRLLDFRLIISVAAYGLAAIFWLLALMGVDLMVAYPTLSLTYVVIGVIAPRLFAEEISRKRWSGIILIVIGVVMMNI